ncbi:30S ribosomal protein S15 [Campylobacter troglodytis]|uniref:30S ribosomal protein S15 n=1 Tax=Campylobacter troglodytis TaxID=654363 RepID=UPI001159DBD0|nr:30S ribosomal protein S15 [Campylobacter troglodytis]TQR61620.1 30S ribosomal protein S15 [Campylobacter troglodytis]
MALDSAKKAAIVAKFARKEGDTGSAEVQIALLSARISDLTEHLKIYSKDFSSRLGLLKLVGQRKRLLAYLKRRDYNRYAKLVSELKIRDKS